MGFEQLAALRDQLAAQAKSNAPAQKKSPGKNRGGQQQGKPGPDGRQSGPRQPGAQHADAQQPDARHAAGQQPAKPQQGRKGAPPRNAQQPAKDIDPVILAISRLQRRFPKTFPKHPDPKFPLKLGIHKDLILQSKELQLDEDEIKTAIKTWCEGRRYWTCMVEGAARIDLQGESSGLVTAEEAQRAKRLSARARSKAHGPRKPAGEQSGEQQARQPGEPRPGKQARRDAKQPAAGPSAPTAEQQLPPNLEQPAAQDLEQTAAPLPVQDAEPAAAQSPVQDDAHVPAQASLQDGGQTPAHETEPAGGQPQPEAPAAGQA